MFIYIYMHIKIQEVCIFERVNMFIFGRAGMYYTSMTLCVSRVRITLQCILWLGSSKIQFYQGGYFEHISSCAEYADTFRYLIARVSNVISPSELFI